MSDQFLYVKTSNGRYKRWGMIYDAFNGVLPFGIWLVKSNSRANIEDRLITLEDLKSVPLVAKRIELKDKILQYLMDNRHTPKSYEDMACELAMILAPNKKVTKKIKQKGVRLRK